MIDTLASTLHPTEYDADRGVVRPIHPTPVRHVVVAATSSRRVDPHAAFFRKANPDHGRGTELACVAALAPANLTALGRRLVPPPRGGADPARGLTRGPRAPR